MTTAGVEPAVAEWVAAHVPGVVPPLTFDLVSGGRSNLTYRVTDASGTVRALRRPPTGGVLSTAHDMSREWRFQTALAPTAVPVPTPLAYCADASVTGAEFYVMGFVDGTVGADQDAVRDWPERARRRAGTSLIEVLAALHELDPAEVGLGDMARPRGYVERQLHRWQRQVHRSGAPDLKLLDTVHDALLARVPAQRTGIVHGDFRPGNLSFAPDGTVIAVFDWELATLGDPLADLGWLVSTWEQPGDTVPPTTAGPSAAPGFCSRTDLIDAYAKASDVDVSQLSYYVAFSRWRSACIGAGVAARFAAGVMGENELPVQELERQVLRQSEAAYEAVGNLGRL
ncbi:phosphotransferase family protein [Streptomyces sp. NBC_00006]|uniref:phosphotransferase family protein n=1 Tax=Streptomyces sp. NBC_00006 TaxID=2975619 RepID=UPI002257FF1E|nr:phosphotransferase family protein [Streptomyces sp. NBC_00006]MCX5536276.1 phosphotransferase family protein [Streptomyces sp. NBC_00006]